MSPSGELSILSRAGSPISAALVAFAGNSLTTFRRCRDSFDAIYGASAGAINATYFLTGQREGVDIYAEDIANRTFCDLSRLLGPSKSAACHTNMPAAGVA
jgi:hypothetical protein